MGRNSHLTAHPSLPPVMTTARPGSGMSRAERRAHDPAAAGRRRCRLLAGRQVHRDDQYQWRLWWG